MRLHSCLLREMRHRPLGWLLSLLALTVAASAVIAAAGLLKAHDVETNQLVAELEARAIERMKALNNEARIFSKNLGFNILLLPEDQELARFWANDSSDSYLDPAIVDNLSTAKLDNLNHLLPMLRQRVDWPVFGGPVTLVGIEGEIYIKNPKKQKPIEQAIEPGAVLLGHTLHSRLGVKEGDTIDLLGRKLTVSQCLGPKGNVDDITLLMNLGDMQRLLNKPKAISGILALSCDCAGGRVEPIIAELAQHVDGVQVVQFTVRARARERARNSIREAAAAEVDDITVSRENLRSQLANLAGVLIVVIAGTAALLVFVLTWVNVRERSGEIAILRTLGLSRWRILSLIMWKTGLIGTTAGILGVVLGCIGARAWAGDGATADISVLLVVVIATIALSKVAALFPALSAANTDPASILNQEGVQ